MKHPPDNYDLFLQYQKSSGKLAPIKYDTDDRQASYLFHISEAIKELQEIEKQGITNNWEDMVELVYDAIRPLLMRAQKRGETSEDHHIQAGIERIQES
jgi:hypothetical protein